MSFRFLERDQGHRLCQCQSMAISGNFELILLGKQLFGTLVFRFEMLPLPSTFTYSSKQSNIYKSWFRNYVRRSRATNLAVSLLAIGLLLSLTLNFRLWVRQRAHSSALIAPINSYYLQASLQPFTASHLIIVAGHAIWKVSVSTDPTGQEVSLLNPYYSQLSPF